MLEQMLEKKNITPYRLSKDTGIPYSTLSDIVSGKTAIQSISAQVLYKLAKGLGMTMEEVYEGTGLSSELYLYNEGRLISIYMNGKHFSYQGPRNLVGFRNIVSVKSDVIYADCYFLNSKKRIYVEEDYIDLRDVMEGYTDMLAGSYTVLIGHPGESRARFLLENSLLVSDNMAIMPADNGTGEVIIEVSNIRRNKDKMLLRLKDYAVLFSNMSPQMQKRAVDTAHRNQEFIEAEMKERMRA